MLIHETLSTPVKYTPDVLVCGGGFAGIAAALAAARCGKKVMLIEYGYMLGGLGTAGLVNIYLPLCDGYGHQVSFGLAEELLRLSIKERKYQTRGTPNWIDSDAPEGRTADTQRFEVDFNPHLFAIAAEKQLLAENVHLLYGTKAVAAQRENGRVTAVIAENKSGRFAICAGAYVDATGDAEVGMLAGVPTADFGQGNILAAWYYFVNQGGLQRKMLGASDIPDEEKKRTGATRQLLVDRRFAGREAEEITEFMVLGHDVLLRHYHEQNSKDPSYDVTTIASMPQLRMVRRVDGEYTLDTSEAHTSFDDSVGMVSNWRKRGPVWEVPFRTLYSAGTENLFFAGRCTSVTDALWDIMRVIPCCSVTGEAAGAAAALAVNGKAETAQIQSLLVSRGVKLHLNEVGL